jgi:uncharacterized protein YdiU (UPF0061 family)
MKREDLKKLGLDDEIIAKAGLEAHIIDDIMALHGKDIEKYKSDLEATKTELESVKAQLGEASKTIEGFKKLNPEELQKSAEEWKQKYEAAQAEAQEKLKSVKFEHTLDNALASAKAKNIKAVKALLDMQNLKFDDDGKIVNLDEQLNKLKTENDYLFESEQPEPKIVLGGKNKSVIGDGTVIAARRAAGLPVEETKQEVK